ncbi:MAG TPA: PRTRC system ThiF family protein [Verrucomicrobiae bacterium]|jgi:PRTRC genetic system ThiF family protein|nr:PRTRC system ThiF family protein [Verrucomicrobiae bacterium]
MIPHKLHKDLVGAQVSIDLVGCGGNGSQMLNGLARMHIALQSLGHPGLKVIAFDGDSVSEANVGRQLFSPSDIGQNKASVLIHRLNCYYGLGWTAVPRMSDGGTLQPHIVIGCVDTITSRRAISRNHFHYWLDLGNRDRTGQVILGAPKWYHNKGDHTRPRTVLEIFPELNRGKVKEDNTTPSCSLAAALERQDLFINQSVATWALQLLWSFLRHGETYHQGYFINLETGNVRPILVPQPPPGKTLAEIFGGKPA